MLAVGCLLLIILPIAGFAMGGAIAGSIGARWGAGIGIAIAGGMMVISACVLAKLKRR